MVSINFNSNNLWGNFNTKTPTSFKNKEDEKLKLNDNSTGDKNEIKTGTAKPQALRGIVGQNGSLFYIYDDPDKEGRFIIYVFDNNQEEDKCRLIKTSFKSIDAAKNHINKYYK